MPGSCRTGIELGKSDFSAEVMGGPGMSVAARASAVSACGWVVGGRGEEDSELTRACRMLRRRLLGVCGGCRSRSISSLRRGEGARGGGTRAHRLAGRLPRRRAARAKGAIGRAVAVVTESRGMAPCAVHERVSTAESWTGFRSPRAPRRPRGSGRPCLALSSLSRTQRMESRLHRVHGLKAQLIATRTSKGGRPDPARPRTAPLLLRSFLHRLLPARTD